MLIVAKKTGQFSFGKLMEVYAEGNLENGRECWPEQPAARQIALAEQDFYRYLQDVFFRTQGAKYLIWEEGGRYVSALRLEPYRDGLLLAALETIPQLRGKGYGKQIVRAALEEAAGVKVYAHVHKDNLPSLRTHLSCGFQKVMDHAVYLDGSVNDRCCTLCCSQ